MDERASVFLCGKGGCLIRIVLLYVFLLGAAVTDLTRGKVFNTWLALGVVFGICCVGRDFFLPAAVMLTAGFFLFWFRMMGAGDGKMMAVIAGYLGLHMGLRAIGTGFLVGAVWSLCRLWRDRSLKARLWYFLAYFTQMFQEKRVKAYDELSGTNGRHHIPFAACLAAGVCLYLFCSGAFWLGGRIL